MSKFCLTKML